MPTPALATLPRKKVLRRFPCFFRTGLQILRRYIDDLLLLWAGDVQSLVEKAEGWHPSLKFQVSGEMEVPFLDFHLSTLPNRLVHWKLFEKPQNLYLYVPAFSNHPASTFASLQLGGAIRCERRNRLFSDYAASIRSFRRRLKDRGFDLAGFDRYFSSLQSKADEKACCTWFGTESLFEAAIQQRHFRQLGFPKAPTI